MRPSRFRFRPRLDTCEARLLMASGIFSATGGANGNASNPVGPPPVATSSITADPLLYAFTKAYTYHVGQANYNPAVDTNHNGVVGRKDAYALLREVTPNARRGPLYLTLALGPQEQAKEEGRGKLARQKNKR